MVAGLIAGAWAWAAAGELVVKLSEERLRISAPGLHFLSGKPLERLKSGASVEYEFQLTLWVTGRSAPRERRSERHVVSYDLWEEKFSVTARRQPRKPASHLTAAAAEAWCLEDLSLPASAAPADRAFRLRLDVRVMEARNQEGIVGESGLNLRGLIEALSRQGGGGEPHWWVESGPLRLEDLRR